MQGNVGVACLHQIAHLFRRPVAAVNVNRMVAGQCAHAGKGIGIELLVDTLDNESDIVVRRKSLGECAYGCLRILSLRIAGEIEDEQEDESIVRNFEMATAGFSRSGLAGSQDGWHLDDRNW